MIQNLFIKVQAFVKDDKDTKVHLIDGSHFVLEAHW